MAQPAKRIAVSSVNWAKLAERLTPEQQNELDYLKQQNSTFHAEIVQHTADPPKVDWAALKKQMPEQSAALETLQKQWESLNIPYGAVPEKFTKEIEKWTQYNQTRIEFNERKVKDKLQEIKKIESKWAKAPPVEHMHTYVHFPHFFPHEYSTDTEKEGYVDWRIHHDDGEWRFLENWGIKGVNANENSHYRDLYHDYNVYPAADTSKFGYGIPDGSGQVKPPEYWPEPLTEAGRKYVKELKAKKKQQAETGSSVAHVDHH